MRIREVTDRTSLLGLKADWDKLWRAGSNASVFLSFEWVFTWWEHFARGQLFVLVGESGDQVRCIAPLMLTRERFLGIPYRRVRFIGSDPTGTTKRNVFDRVFSIDRRCGWADLLDVLYEAGDMDSLRATLEYLSVQRPRWDILDLRELPRHSLTAELMEEVFGDEASLVREVTAKVAILSLDGDFEAYKGSRARNWRKNINGTFNRMSKLPDLTFAKYASATEIARMMPVVIDLENRSWQGRQGVGAFSHDGTRAFHCALAGAFAEKGRLLLYTLESAGAAISYQYAFVHNNRLHLYTTAMDPQFNYYSPGFYLMIRVIEDAYADGLERVVLGRGPEEYKHKLKNDEEDRIRITVFGTAVVPRLLASCEFRARPALRRLVRRDRMGVEPSRAYRWHIPD